MVKTQIQLPDRLYKEAKRVAEEHEMSFAEVVRRGLEQFLKHYPEGRRAGAEWRPPKPHDLGEALLPEDEWTAASHD